MSEKYGGQCFRHRESETSRVRYFQGFRKPEKCYGITVNGTQGGESRVHNPRMQMQRRLFLSLLSGCPGALLAQQGAAPARSPDVPFVPTPQNVVEAMLKLADVKKGDVLYDLGSGDGRMVITAAKLYGVKGTGIDIDPKRIQEANENAKEEGVDSMVRFLNQDLFESNFSDATVVTLYLLPGINLKLRPKLWKELKPGTRIVSHSFDMGDWEPQKKTDVDGRILYFWTIPARRAAR
jgi:hypothetical protein